MKLLSLIFSFIFLHTIAIGQINLNEYTDGLNGYYTGVDTAYQLFDEIKTQQDENRMLLTYFPFNTNQVDQCYNNIHFPDTLMGKPEVDFQYFIPWANDSNYFKACQLQFTLNNDTAFAFCYKNASSLTNPKTAFIIIPGSGINQATAIAIYNQGNYHNNTCPIAQTCLPYGDVFTYVRPNEDFATFWTSTSPGVFKKLNYQAQTAKTNLLNKNWAANCYIQIIALTKYLQSKYDKVVVMGLSSGAWGVMFSALQTEPDAAILASGYSISFNNQTYTSNFNQMQYDGLFSSHPIDSVRKTVRSQKTQFLFSYGANDNVTNMQDENTNHTTENYFNTPTPPGNTNYFYNFSQHRFPCEVLDSFYTKIKKMPKAFLELVNTCTSDSLILRIRFLGDAPFEGMLYRNNVPYQSIYSLSDTFNITLFDDGEFELKNLIDFNQITGFKSKPIIYNKVNGLIPSPITQQYVCQTDSTSIQLPVSGTPPYTLTCFDSANSTITNYQTSSNIFHFYKKNGNFRITQINDSNNCIWQTPIDFNVNNEPLQITLNTPSYNCDSNKFQLNIHADGRNPWQINFFKSGSFINEVINDSNTQFFLENGQYLFTQISDLNNCQINLNQYFNLYGNPLQSNWSAPIYSCDSNKTKINIQTSGNPPYTFYFLKNNQVQQVTWGNNPYDLYLENGQYNFLYIQDQTSCIDSINLNYVFNYQPIQITLNTPVYDCDSNKRRIQFNLQGNGPWVMNYTMNGQFQLDTFYTNNETRFYANGLYQFIALNDATNCTASINQTYNFNDQALSWNLIQQQFDCLTNVFKTQWTFNGNPPFNIHYTLNNGPIQTQVFNAFNAVWNLPNGVYQLINIEDQTGCIQPMNLSLTPNFSPIAYSMSVPVYDCDSNKRRIQFNLQGNGPWVMNYTMNGQFQLDTFYTNNETRFYANGLYQFIALNDATNCTASINQTYNFNDQALSWNLIQQQYDCDSNLYRIQLNVTGNAPWTVQYELVGGFVFNRTFNNNSINLYLPNGQWVIHQISDATSCSQSINLSYNLSYQSISATSILPVYDCDSNKMKIAYNVQGNEPYTFTLKQLNSNSTQWINTNNNTPSFWLNNGQYLMQEVFDATGCHVSLNQYIQNTVQPLAYQILAGEFDCDSNKINYPVQLQGQAPWNISYRNLTSGLLFNLNSLQALNSISLATGQYAIENISDAYCTLNTTDTLHVHFPAMQVQVNPPSIFCDSGKAAISVNWQNGLLPAKLKWIYNGIPDSINIQNGLQTILLPNGTYFIQSITDSASCTKPLNITYNANYVPLKWLGITQTYNCQIDSSEITINIQGTPQTALYLTYNNTPDTLYLNNGLQHYRWNRGDYHIVYLRDSAQCVLPVDSQLVIRDVPVNFSVDTLTPICDNQLHQYTFSLKGQSPWLLTYNNKNVSRTITFTDSINTWLCEPGRYDFVSIQDANGCTSALERIDSLAEFISYFPELKTDYKELYVIPSQYPITWYYNQQLLDTNQFNTSNIQPLGSGYYQAVIEDFTGCIWPSNEIELKFENLISLFPNPAFNQIAMMNQDDYGEYWTYSITNAIGEKVLENKVVDGFELIKIESWPAGVYFVNIQFQNNNKKNVLRFMKQ